MAKNSKYGILVWVVSSYMTLAIIWWTILLYQQNELVMELSREIKTSSGVDIGLTHQKYLRQKWMILGEAATFGVAMIMGMILLYNSYRKELAVQKNKSNFLMSITHELKTPITTIKLFLQTLKRKINDPKLEEMNQQAIDETERLNELVLKLLTANKLEGGFKLLLSSVKIDKLIQDRIEAYKRRFPDHSIQLINGQEITMQTDSEALRLILDNLIENACKYDKENKDIRIEMNNQNNTLDITVKDKGQGIHEKNPEKLFEKFFRGEDENTRKNQGTGLGLYIVKSIADLMNASVNVESNVGKGSAFTISLKK